MHRWLANRRLWATVVGAAALLVLLAVTARDRSGATPPERWVLDAMAPITEGAHTAIRYVGGLFDRLARLNQLYDENVRLRAQLAEYQRLAARYEQMRAAYERLQQLLDLKQRVGVPVVAAHVIGRNPDHWLQMIFIDVGTRDGVRENMVVAGAEGVVGRVIRVSEHTATVLLLTDPQSGIGVMIAESRDAGVATGQAGEPTLRVRFFSRAPMVKRGDAVVTSGYSAVFPPGLPVGTVVDIEQDAQGLVRWAVVEPAVDFDRLTEVLVLRADVLLPGAPLGGQF